MLWGEGGGSGALGINLDPGLRHAWEHFVRTGTVPRGVRQPIASSWLRCRQLGLDPFRASVQRVPPAELQRRVAAYRPLIDIARPFLKQLVAWHQRSGASGIVAVLVDREGVVLERVADRRAASLVTRGSLMTEESVGTAAVSLVLYQKRPETVSGSEHYLEALQLYTCTAVPVVLAGQSGPFVLAIASHGHTLPDNVRSLLAESASALARAWHALKRGVKQQALLATWSPWPLVALDGDNRVVDCNPAAERELGRPREELLGRRLAEVRPQAAVIERHEGAHGRQQMVVHRLGGGGSRVYLAESAPADDDAARGRVVAFVDVTGYRQREQDAEHKQRLALVERLASLAVHEIRNPLAAIRVTAELAAMVGESDRRGALIQQIISSIDELAGFLDELLALARPEQMARTPVDVLRTLEGVVQLFEPQARRSGLTLRLKGPRRAPAVIGNEQLLRHALINLLRNAFQATPRGGTVTVRLEHLASRGCVLIRVSDTGTGIPPHCRLRLFTGAVTTKGPHGVGLGLLFTHRIITETHGGRIWFRTREGAGTTFYIQLPVAPGLPAEGGPPAATG